MSEVKLFRYKNTIHLTVDNIGRLENFPMYNRDCKIFKGVDNKINFAIKDHNRKVFRTIDKDIIINIINDTTNKTCLIKKLEIVDEYQGQYELNISQGETELLDAGRYRLVAKISDFNHDTKILYSGVDYDPILFLDVYDNVYEPFRPSIELNPKEFIFNSYYKGFVSTPVNCKELLGFENDILHTFSVQTSNFIGKLYVQGTLEDTNPLTDDDWYNIQINGKDYIQFGLIPESGIKNELTDYLPETSTKVFTFNAQCQQIRFIYKEQDNNPKPPVPALGQMPSKDAIVGKIEKIYYRF